MVPCSDISGLTGVAPVVSVCVVQTFSLVSLVRHRALLRSLSAVGLCLGRSGRLLLRACLACCAVLIGYGLGCRRIGLVFLLAGS